MGFRPTIDKILHGLPNKNQRQTLLFSATFPANVQQLASYAFRPSYATVDTVGQETGTNVQVRIRVCAVCRARSSSRRYVAVIYLAWLSLSVSSVSL